MKATPSGLTLDDPVPLPRESPVMGKPEEIERSRFDRGCGRRERPWRSSHERHQPSLIRMERQAILPEALRQNLHYPTSILLAGEALHLQPSQVFEVLLHEAAHGLNTARGIKDASRGGRYHNARFKSAAAELGLIVSQMPPYGWAQTALGPPTLERYESDISRLGHAMRVARRLSADVRIGEVGSDQEKGQVEGDGQAPGEGPAKAGPAACGCGRKMRMAPSILAQGPVLCGLCGHEFSTERRTDRPSEPELAGSLGAPTVDDRFLDTAVDPTLSGLRRDGGGTFSSKGSRRESSSSLGKAP